MMGLRYGLFILLYAVWVIGYTFQTSVTRAAQAVLTNDPQQRPLFTIFNTIGSLAGMGVMQFIGPILARDSIFGDYNRSWFAAITPIGICISVLLTILAIIGIWEKDQPKYFGLGGKQETVKVSEYIQIIKANKPLQRLMIAGGGCKLALSVATNITVLIMLYSCMMGDYDGLYLPMMIIGYDFQDQVTTDDLQNWFNTAEGPSDIFVLPGYSLSVLKTDEYTQYYVLSPADQIPQLSGQL